VFINKHIHVVFSYLASIATGGESGGAESDVLMPGCSDWTAVTGTRKERRQIDRSADEHAHIASMTGIEKTPNCVSIKAY